jgi:hypothetical protein
LIGKGKKKKKKKCVFLEKMRKQKWQWLGGSKNFIIKNDVFVCVCVAVVAMRVVL